jgi:putative membrane protein
MNNNFSLKSLAASWKFQTIIASIFFSVGIAGHIFQPTLELMLLLTPYVLLVTGLWSVQKVGKKPVILYWLFSAYAITFSLEALGVASAKVFGPYFYGNVLGPMFLEVPVIIGFNWVFIIFSLSLLSEYLVTTVFQLKAFTKTITGLLTALFAVGFDFIMEPAAVGLQYWTWTQTDNPFDIPLQNYIAWFIIALLFSTTYVLIPKQKRLVLSESPHSPWYVLIQIVFFLCLRIGFGWY